MDVSEGTSLSKTRRTWFSAVAIVFALVFGVGFFSWIGLVTGWFEGGERQIHRVHDIGSSGIATGLLIAVPLLILSWRRDDIALLQMLGVAAVATLVGAVLATEPAYTLGEHEAAEPYRPFPGGRRHPDRDVSKRALRLRFHAPIPATIAADGVVIALVGPVLASNRERVPDA
jgi:hypothetical protein